MSVVIKLGALKSAVLISEVLISERLSVRSTSTDTACRGPLATWILFGTFPPFRDTLCRSDVRLTAKSSFFGEAGFWINGEGNGSGGSGVYVRGWRMKRPSSTGFLSSSTSSSSPSSSSSSSSSTISKSISKSSASSTIGSCPRGFCSSRVCENSRSRSFVGGWNTIGCKRMPPTDEALLLCELVWDP